MEILKSASFGTLFQVTFVVAAAFQVAAFAIGLPFALLSPGAFTLNGRPAQSTGEALIVLVMLLVMMLAMNAAISAGGSGLWLLVRKALFRKPSPAQVF